MYLHGYFPHWGDFYEGLRLTWDKPLMVTFACMCWRSRPKHKLDMNPSSTLFKTFFLLFFLFLTVISCSLISYWRTTSLLPAWGRSMHVLYSGPVASSVSSSHLFLSLFLSFSPLLLLSLSIFFSLCALSHSHTNKQWCLICRLFTFH